MAVTPVDSVDEFCTGGDRTAYTVGKLVTGYTGADNDPAFAENINDYFNLLSVGINNHTTIINGEIIPIVDTIAALQAQSDRNTFPVFTSFAYLGDIVDLPADWAACQGQTFNEISFPLLFTANGDSNVLPDLRDFALIGASAGTLVSTNGSVISHNHDGSPLSATSAGTHSHNSFGGNVPNSGGGAAMSNNVSGSPQPTTTAGAHSHSVSGNTGATGTTGNVPKSQTCHWIVKLE